MSEIELINNISVKIFWANLTKPAVIYISINIPPTGRRNSPYRKMHHRSPKRFPDVWLLVYVQLSVNLLLIILRSP